MLYPLADQRCYVTVAVGNQKKKTSTFKRTADDKNPPHWNEEFTLWVLWVSLSLTLSLSQSLSFPLVFLCNIRLRVAPCNHMILYAYTSSSNGAVLLHHCFSYQFDILATLRTTVCLLCQHIHTHSHTRLPQPMFQLARDDKDQSLVSGSCIKQHGVSSLDLVWEFFYQ